MDSHRQRIGRIISSKKIALLVIDKQYGYFDPKHLSQRDKTLAPHHEEKVARLDDFIEATRKAGVPVIWTQMTEDVGASPKVISEILRNDSEVSTIAKKGERGYDFYGIHPNPGEKVVEKLYYDAFIKTDLAKYLEGNAIEAVLIVGGFYGRCVYSTAMGALNADIKSIVVKDLCFTPLEFADEESAITTLIKDIVGYVSSSDFIKQCYNEVKE